jgi:hypothetical protein
MDRLRSVLGLLGGGIIAASSALHALMGWPAMAGELTRIQASPDLVAGLRVGWYFGSVAMLAFGLVAIVTFAARMRGQPASLAPVVIVAVTYLAFGLWALVASGMNPFFLIFIVPALMLLIASWSRGDAAPATRTAPDAVLR